MSESVESVCSSVRTEMGSHSVRLTRKTRSGNFQVEEIRTLANNRGKFAECGTHIAGKRCVLIRDSMDSNLTLDMKSAADCDGNSFGVCAGKSKQVMIVVRGAKDIRSGPLSDKVYNVCEHLRKANM